MTAPASASTIADRLLRRPAAGPRVDAREKIRASIGAGIAIAVTAVVVRWLAGIAAPGTAWLAAPLGASAVLVFAVPSSPLAQPWSVIGGNTVSALLGAACGALVPDPAWAGGLAVAVAIAAMFQLRCLHPPGGAAALLAAIGGAAWTFAVFPILVDTLLLVGLGIAYNELTGRRYPHRRAPSTAAPASRFSDADLDAALARYNQVIDVDRDDLADLLHHAEAAAYERSFGHLVCGDVMSREPLSVQFGEPLDDAWTLMRSNRIKALPITDHFGHVVGIVTVTDFLEHAGLDRPDGIGRRLRGLLRRDGRVHSEKAATVGQIMTRRVQVASVEKPVAELVPLFASAGHHHIPVIDDTRRLVGVLTQSDVVRALHRATQPSG